MNISVVIPLFNKEKHIQRAITSVLGQTHQDFELVIVDDGSTDGSYEAANAIKDPRMRFIRQENKGVSVARNRGVAEAKYDWVAFLDADDEWLPEFLEKISELISQFPGCGMYGSSHYRVTSGNILTVSARLSEMPIGWKGVFEDYCSQIGDVLPYHSSAVLLSKSSLTIAGGFPENLRIWEDTDTWMRVALNYGAAFINIPLAIYHVESEDRTKVEPADFQKILEKWQQMLNSNKIPQKYSASFKENFLARYQFMFAKYYLKKYNLQMAKRLLKQIPVSSRYFNQSKKIMRCLNIPAIILIPLIYINQILLKVTKKIDYFLGF